MGKWYLKVENKLVYENVDRLIWLRVWWPAVRKNGNRNSASKNAEIFRSTRQLSASQERLFSTEFIYIATKRPIPDWFS